MRTILVVIFITCAFSAASQITTNSQWKWLKGDSLQNNPGSYGIKGMPDSTNEPAARYGSTSWSDAAGNLWLFGGFGYFNDLWKYDPATNLWTWMKGNNT